MTLCAKIYIVNFDAMINAYKTNSAVSLIDRKIPHIEIVQLTENEIAAIIRPELNIEKFSNFIFPHRKAEGLNQVREKEWDIKLKEGSQAQ